MRYYPYQQATTPTRPVCRHEMTQTGCLRGARCTFLHQCTPERMLNPATPLRRVIAPSFRQRVVFHDDENSQPNSKICLAHLSGECAYESTCRYEHINGVRQQERWIRRFAGVQCKNGADCAYKYTSCLFDHGNKKQQSARCTVREQRHNVVRKKHYQEATEAHSQSEDENEDNSNNGDQ